MNTQLDQNETAARADEAVEESRLDAATAEQFLQRTYPPKEPLIRGLLHRRDQVAFGARRRHGKTLMVTNIAVAGALGLPRFLGYEIPAPFRTLMVNLEDDPGEYQSVLGPLVGERSTRSRLYVLTRDDFHTANIRIDVGDKQFCEAIRVNAETHRPDAIVFDNLAHIIAAEYSDPKRVHQLTQFTYALARDFNAAILMPAHPRKQGEERISLRDNPEGFYESIMGSSHFINSMGSIWGLEREEVEGLSYFLAGRQRGEGTHGVSAIRKGENGWFELVAEAAANSRLVLNTPKRRQAWGLLPDHPMTFGYREGQELVKAALSGGAYADWIKECRRLRIVLGEGDKLMKSPDAPNELLHGPSVGSAEAAEV